MHRHLLGRHILDILDIGGNIALLDILRGGLVHGDHSGGRYLLASIGGGVQVSLVDGLLHHNFSSLRLFHHGLLNRGLTDHLLRADFFIFYMLLNFFLGDVVGDQALGRLGGVDDGLLEGSILANDGLLHGRVIHSLLDDRAGGILGHGLVGDLGLVFNLMFHLLVVSHGDLDRGIISVLDGLIISEGLGNLDLLTQSSDVGLEVLTLVRDGFIRNDWLVVGIELLDRDIFDPSARLRGT